MAALPPTGCPTLAAADKQMIATAPRWRGRNIGVGTIGGECTRAIWYKWRWVSQETFDALSLKRFADGHSSEAVALQRIAAVPGVTLTTGPGNGKQWPVEACGGHLQGRLDGAVLGLVQAPKTWHVTEVKCTAKMADLAKAIRMYGEKAALKAWNPVYYAAAVLYMHLTGMTRHWLVATAPGARDPWYGVRTECDPVEAGRLLAKAQRIIDANTPPERIGASDFWLCRMCSFAPQCHGGAWPHGRNCRTCIYAGPVADGGWHCAHHEHALTHEAQLAGCPSHRYIPDLVPGKQVDVRDGAVVYNVNANEWVDDGSQAVPSRSS